MAQVAAFQAGTALPRPQPNTAVPFPTIAPETLARALADPGRTTANPITGERLTFVVTAGETGGAYCLVQGQLPAGSGVRFGRLPAHQHRTKTEIFHVVEGTLDFRLGAEAHLVLKPGDTIVVPPMTRHRFWNSSDGSVTLQVEIRPTERFEQFIRLFNGMAEEGRCSQRGIPFNPLDMALLTEYGMDGLPLPMLAFFRALIPLARWAGRDHALRKYLASA